MRIDLFVVRTKKRGILGIRSFANKSWLSLTMFRIGCRYFEWWNEG